MKMTENRRIILNIAATYLRSFYTLALGLVTARWLLMSLGKIDYGLLGLVGGLAAFVTFLNRSMSGAVSRFYALSIGKERKKGLREEGLEECRRWFSVAVSIHLLIPVALVAVGWPVGEWLVRCWLDIPHDRVVACVWVWRFTCVDVLLGMVNAPFRAMYSAKQEIAELTFYSMATATLNAFLLYWMVTHPRDWLACYALLNLILHVVPRIAICARAFFKFPECRIRRTYLWHWADAKRLLSFAGWSLYTHVGLIARNQGLSILVNKMLGPVFNTAWTVANRLAVKSNTFSASLIGSFSPAILTAHGAGRSERAHGLVYRICKLGGLLVVVVLLPLVLEVHEVMRLWLRDPPSESPLLCVCVACVLVIQKMSSGLSIAISASLKVAAAQFAVGTCYLCTLPLAWLLMVAGCGLYSVGLALVAMTFFAMVSRLYFARRNFGISPVKWLHSVAAPILFSAFCAGLAGAVPRFSMPPSLLRVLLTAVCVECILMPMIWFRILSVDERDYVVSKFCKIVNKLRTNAVRAERPT